MPRGPRLDHVGALHHVMARGIERREIFTDDLDRGDFVRRLERLASEAALGVYAWALMPNHVHLLVRTAARSLASSMRSLLGGYATSFNRRHGRVGHLFQNRYKSVLCDEEAYFLTLVSYIHLNPLRSGHVGGMDELDRYPWTGHSAIMRHHPRPWQDVKFVLDALGENGAGGLAAYRTRLMSHLGDDAPVDLEGGGLRRSQDGLEAVETLAHGRERFRSDERILGRSAFTESILREQQAARLPRRHALDFEELVALVSAAFEVNRAVVPFRGRSRFHAELREAVAFLWIYGLGRSGHSLANRIGVTKNGVYAAAKRGLRQRDRWLGLLEGSMRRVAPVG